ncbi:MAG: hypothetical protein ACYDAR_18265 [Thermomicrobiales bacterium]
MNTRVAGKTSKKETAGETPAGVVTSCTGASDVGGDETAIATEIATRVGALRERQQRLHALLDAAEREQQARERQLETVLVNNALGHPAVEALNRAGPYVRRLEKELADARAYIMRLEEEWADARTYITRLEGEWAAATAFIPTLERALREARVRIITLEAGRFAADSSSAENEQ